MMAIQKSLIMGHNNKMVNMIGIFKKLSEGITIDKKPEFQSLVNFSNFKEHPIHRWFKYREGYSIDLVNSFIRADTPGKILDPFCGSGTSLIAAKENGIDSVGFDINPLSTFISETKFAEYNNNDLNSLKELIPKILSVSNREFYYAKPGLEIIDKVFNEEILETLMKIKNNINQIEHKKYHDFFMLGWLSILESVSNTKKEGNGIKYKFTKRTSEGYKQLPQKKWEDEYFGKNKKGFFLNILENKYHEMLEDLEKKSFKKCDTKVYTTSSLNLTDYIKEETISTCIFSPPYANSFDYFEIFKVELWMGGFVKSYDELKKLRKDALRSNFNALDRENSEIKFKQEQLEQLLRIFEEDKVWDKKIKHLIRGYFEDMYITLKGVYEVLKPDGKCVIVVGNSAYSGVIIPTDLLLADIGLKIGFKRPEVHITRHLTTSSQQKESLMLAKEYLRESIIVLHKSSSEYEKVDELPVGKNINNGQKFIITSNNVSYLTHAIHKYPAKFIPQIPRWAIRKYTTGKECLVLDPFCGSGTTLVESAILGRKAYGIDIDPLSRLITKVKTTRIPGNEINKVSREVLERVNKKDVGMFRPKIPNLKHWFTDEATRDLSIIRDTIEEYKAEKDIYDFLIICFSSIIRRVSNADNQSQKTYVSHTNIKEPEKVIPLFKKTLGVYTKRMEEWSKMTSPYSEAKVLNGCTDSRNFSKYWKDKINVEVDVAVTSPPYIKAVDYIYNQMVEHFWIGDLFELHNQKLQNAYSQKYMGTQRVSAEIYSEKLYTQYPTINSNIDKVYRTNKKFAYILGKFFIDMEKNLLEVKEVLREGGHYVIVIGDNNVAGIPINSHELLCEIAKNNGFGISNLFAYKIRNRFMRFPRSGRGGLIKEDWIVDLKKL